MSQLPVQIKNPQELLKQRKAERNAKQKALQRAQDAFRMSHLSTNQQNVNVTYYQLTISSISLSIPQRQRLAATSMCMDAASPPLIWTLSEPYYARSWWPCKDTSSDKADSVDIFVTVSATRIAKKAAHS